MIDLDKREKVIKGLECCMSGQPEGLGCDRVPCPYNEFEDCEGMLHHDALALLKKREPRVMTLGEIMECGDAEIMYLETGVYEKDIKPAIFQPENTQEGYFCFVSGWKFSGFYHVDNYKINWRCWTSRPTDEQREATPWDVGTVTG